MLMHAIARLPSGDSWLTLPLMEAIIRMLSLGGVLRRTTVFADDEVLDTLQIMDRRRGIALAEVTREALTAYMLRHRNEQKPLTLAGAGRSRRRDIAVRSEHLLRKGFGG